MIVVSARRGNVVKGRIVKSLSEAQELLECAEEGDEWLITINGSHYPSDKFVIWHNQGTVR